jgi:hypothetical protein
MLYAFGWAGGIVSTAFVAIAAGLNGRYELRIVCPMPLRELVTVSRRWEAIRRGRFVVPLSGRRHRREVDAGV